MAVAAAVITGLRKLSTEAVPETLEILMQATSVDSATLLRGLLRSVPFEIKEAQKVEVETVVTETEIDTPKLITYVAALLYLLKSSAQDHDVVDKVVWTICIPLLRIEHSKSGPLQIETFIPAASIQEMAGSGWEESRYVSNCCQLIAVLLESAIESTREENASTILGGDTIASAKCFCKEVVHKFLEPALAFLSQPYQTTLRHHAISTLLPPILRTIIRLGVAPANTIRSTMPETRSTAAQKIWGSCKILFSQGHLQRHDAYVALAAFAEYLFPPVQLENELLLLQRNPKKFGVVNFDVRDDPFFWDELRAGLVHDDPSIRERSLFVLKQALPNYPNTSERGEECTTGNIRFERWSAFVFLYEILDEYKSVHLVEGTLSKNILLAHAVPSDPICKEWDEGNCMHAAQGQLTREEVYDMIWAKRARPTRLPAIPEHSQGVLSPETLSRSETSTKTFSGSIDSTTWSSDAVSHSQKLLRPRVRSLFQRPGNASVCSYEGKGNSSLETLGSKRHGESQQLQVQEPQQELIVVATAPADISALAGFARTCEVFEIAKLVIVPNTGKRQEYHNNRLTPTCSIPLEVLETSLTKYLKHKKKEGFALLGLGKGAGSVLVGNYSFPDSSVLILGGEYGIPTDIISMLDVQIEVANPDGQHPLDVFVAASIVLWEYAQQYRSPRLNVCPMLRDR